ncbi:MAG: hypothetical protein KDD64_12825, partial [Bdellovibrionales bacterium]|nr:hypothetical protein [Bdellovibrionales bacterium]
MTIKKSVLLFAVILQLCSCGGGGSQSSEVGLQAELDSSRSFAPGEAVPFTVSTTNFTLVPPFNMRGLQPRHHEGSEHEDSETDHEISDEIETGNSGDDHSHVNGVLNPDAREGHYHIYLDDAEGSDPHLTAWSSSGSY